VKRKIFLMLFLLLFISLFLSSHKSLSSKGLFFSNRSAIRPQDVSVKKPKDDYMSTFLSRNTKPLGLKKDATLQKLLKQPSIKWAIRAGKKHILN
jgi:hypothetical protein